MLWTHRVRVLVVIAILLGAVLVLLVTRRTSGGEPVALDAGFGGVGGGGLDAARPLDAGKRD
jgi:hypothetical protein